MPKEVPPKVQAEDETQLQEAVQEISAAEEERAQPEESKEELFQRVVADEIDKHDSKIENHEEMIKGQQELITALKGMVEKQSETLEKQNEVIEKQGEKIDELEGKIQSENRELKYYEGDYYKRPGESDADWEARIREQALEDSGGNEKYADQMVQWQTQERFERSSTARNAREKIADTYKEHEQAEKELQEQLDNGSITQMEYDQQRDKLETEALQKVDLLERAKDRARDKRHGEYYANEDSSAFYDEANTIASEADAEAYERWQQKQDEEYENLSDEDRKKVAEKVGDNKDLTGEESDAIVAGLEDGGDVAPTEDGEGGGENGGEDEGAEDEPNDEDVKESLIAGRTIREKEARIHAEQVAEEALNRDLETMKGPFKGLRKMLKGTAFRSLYRIKYRDMAEARLRLENGGGLNEGELKKLEKARDSRAGKILTEAMSIMEFGDGDEVNERMIRGGTGEGVLVREKAGERAELADEKLTNTARSIMEEYISGKMMEKYESGELNFPKGMSEKEVLDKSMDTLRAEMQAGGEFGDGDALAVDNFVEIAEMAKARSEALEDQIEDFGDRMDRVFDGFQLVSAESRGVTRSETHRTNIDKIVDRMENSRVGRYLPPTAVAAISGAGLYLGQRIATRSASVALPIVGGAIIGGVFAGMREGNRLAIDRATRGVARERGLAGGESGADRKIDETEYDTYSVIDLTNEMRQAKEAFEASGSDDDRIAWIEATKKAAVLQDYADENKVGLLAYDSSGERSLAQQQTEFLSEISAAMATLSQEERENFLRATDAEDDVIRQVKESIERDVSAKDDVFKKTRRWRRFATGAKTFAISAGTGLAIQEMTALVNPNQYGLLERGLNRLGVESENSSTARDTALASIFEERGERSIGSEFTKDQIGEYENNDRYRIAKNDERGYHEVPRTEERPMGADRAPDHWASNGTNYSDGNELRLESGYARLPETSYDPGTGETINPANSKVEFLVRAGGRSEVLDAVRDANGNWVPEDPSELAQFYDSDGRFTGDMLHVGVSNENGWTSLATDIGTGTHDGMITKTVIDKIADPITYTVYEEIDVAPAIPIGEAGRRNLSGSRRIERQPEPVVEAEPGAVTEPESGGEAEAEAETEPAAEASPAVEAEPESSEENEEDLEILVQQFTDALGGDRALAERGVAVSNGEDPFAFRRFWANLNDEQKGRLRAVLPDNARQRFGGIIRV